MNLAAKHDRQTPWWSRADAFISALTFTLGGMGAGRGIPPTDRDGAALYAILCVVCYCLGDFALERRCCLNAD
jgi:hypothetical protein